MSDPLNVKSAHPKGWPLQKIRQRLRRNKNRREIPRTKARGANGALRSAETPGTHKTRFAPRNFIQARQNDAALFSLGLLGRALTHGQIVRRIKTTV
jgi:hypothetical protein